MSENINPNAKSCLSQEAKILAFMIRGFHITPLYALKRFNCERLAARIADIRKKGYQVKSEFVTLESGKRVKSYWLDPTYY